jgi:ribosomal protein S18 acetylase RimI-like enzyme
MIRALRPTDALAYVTFHHHLTRSAEGAGEPLSRARRWAVPVLIDFLGRSLALEPGREAWVQIDHGRISGLVAAKKRDGADLWDVDELSVLPSTDSRRVGSRLLEHLLAAAADEGIQKVFLRLGDEDPAQDWVRQVGFSKYCDEVTYFRPELPTVARQPGGLQLRRRRPADHQALFQLYCSAVPFRVRQAEGMTLHEWRWTDGWAVRPVGLRVFSANSRTDFVQAGDGRITAWLQVDRSARQLALLVDAQSAIDVADIVRFGSARLGSGGPMFCVSRDYQSGLAQALEDANFVAARRDMLFARGLMARLPELKLMPIRAS